MNLENSFKKFLNFLLSIYIFFFFLIHRYYVVILAIFYIFLFLWIMSQSIIVVCDNNDALPELPPTDLGGVFTEKHLLDFYVFEKDPRENLEKLCFSEGIAALSFHLIEIKHADDRLPPLRQVLGKEYFEYFKNYSFFLILNTGEITGLSNFLNTVIYRENFADKGFLESKFQHFFASYNLVYSKTLQPKMNLLQEILYFKEFFAIEELRPFTIKHIFKLYNLAINSSKFFTYVYHEGVTFGYYNNSAKLIMQDFLKSCNQNLIQTYIKLHSHHFDTEKGFIYKVKNILLHLYQVTKFYEDKISNYYFYSSNLCIDDTDFFRFLYLNPDITDGKSVYAQFLIEIKCAETLNTILHYPAVASGRYYIKEIIKGLRQYLELCLAKGVFKNTNEYIYVNTLHGDHRVRRVVKKYLNIIFKGCFIKDEKTITLYKEYAPIFHSIISDNKALLEKKITYKKALETLDFMDKLMDEIKGEEDYLAKKHFPNINEIRRKKIFTKHFIKNIDLEQGKVFTIYYGPEVKNL